VVQDDSTTALDLAAEIACDQSLTLKILGAVNSSYYGFHRQISSVADAVVILGFDEVERLALAISVIDLFSRDSRNVRALHMLWRHSLACSVVAAGLEARFRHTHPAIFGAHVAGLLHDIGKAVIAQYVPEAVEPILRLVQEDGMGICEAEHEVLDGVSHCDVGAWIAERWGLPPAIVEAIAMHHTPDQTPADHVVTHATHIANAVCNSAGIRSMNVNSASSDVVDERTAEILPVEEGLLSQMTSRIERQRGLFGAMAASGVYR
jgi:putative nucleotidyltransferase with HDIG domain